MWIRDCSVQGQRPYAFSAGNTYKRMNEVIVSVRMPKGMADKLKALADSNHYLDVSEEIRSIIRDRSSRYSSQYDQGLRTILADLKNEIKLEHKKDTRKQVIQNLKMLLEDLQDE